VGPSDLILVWRLRRHDREACSELIERHHARVYGYLRSLGADGSLAEDLTQETYARAWTRIDTLREAVTLRSWLLAIARNEFLQRIRVRAPAEVGLEEAAGVAAAGPPADLSAERAERDRRLRDAVGRLEEIPRQAVVLHYFHDLSLREVGAVLGIPPGTVKSRLNRALVTLRSLLEKEESHDRSKPGTAVAGDA
jgi:RNA polymerase sigma-70 factor, ECF subfamily